MRSCRLAGFLLLLLLGLGARPALAQTTFYGFDGATFGQGLGAPMDLAAAISDVNPNIPNSQDYIVQFTNGGIFVYNKNNPHDLVSSKLQWSFWCSGLSLTGCDPFITDSPYDTQISYDSTTGRWIVAALSYDANYLYIGASQTTDPTGTYNLHAISVCAAFDTPQTTYLGDNPIMGLSTGSNGRAVVDLSCVTNGYRYRDEIFDIDITALEGGTPIGRCGGGNCTILTTDQTGKFNVPIELRPANNLSNDSGVVMAAFIPGPNGVARLNLWKLSPGTTGVSSDTLNRFDPRDPQNPSFFYSNTAVLDQPSFLAPQPGCTSSTSICKILTNTLDPLGGMTQTNSDGKPVYAVSFGAAAPNGTDSYYLTFILNQSTGVFNFVPHPVKNGIIGFAQSALDPDGEVVVNYTTFTATGSFTSIDTINRNPIAAASIVHTVTPIASTTKPINGVACSSVQWCRWGDYTAEVYDPDPACDAVVQGKGSECGLFWTTAEWTDGTNQNSWVGAVKDDVLVSEQLVTFAGYDNFTEFEGPLCDGCVAIGSATASPPSGAANGDVFVAVIGAGDVQSGTSLTLPTGWSLLPLANQSGATNVTIPIGCGLTQTSWVAAHTYSASDVVPYNFLTHITTNPDTCNPNDYISGETIGLLASYRGASQNAGSYTAYAYPNPNTYISATPSLSVVGAGELVNIFQGVGESNGTGSSDENGCSEQFLYLSGAPPATGETPAIPPQGVASFFDADVWTIASATLGGYSVWSACAYNYAPTTSTLPAFQIVLPPAVSN